MEVNLKKKNTGLIAGIAVAVVVLAIILVMVFSGGSSDSLQKQLDLGNKYMQEMDYEQAVAAYLAAIEIDERCVEAYIGAAEAYMAMGDEESAVNILALGYDITQDAQIEAMLSEIIGMDYAGDNSSSGDGDGTVVDEGAVYLVSFDDPDLTAAAEEFYQMILSEPENLDAYFGLIDVYMAGGAVDAALDIAKAGYHKTELEDFMAIIDWIEGDGDVADNGSEDEEEPMPEPVLPEVASNQFICGDADSGYYRVTYDEAYVEPRKERGGNYFWIHFDNDNVQESFEVKDDYNSFEEYYNAQKENMDMNVEYGECSDVEFGTPYQITSGNVTINCYKYSYIYCGEKVEEPEEIKRQVFYIDLGDGVSLIGSSDDFWDGYSYYSMEEGSRTITFDEYLSYIFLNVEKVEATVE